MVTQGMALMFGLTFIAFVLNLPFGYMRSKAKRFSFMWFFYIHVPIPFIFILRNLAGIGYQAVPVIVVGAIIGQFLGGRLNNLRIS